MPTATFFDNGSLWTTLAVLGVVLVPAGVLVAGRFGRHRPTAALLAAAVTVELAATLHPEGGMRLGAGSCVVKRDVFALVQTEQWLLNAAMFVPIGLFLGLLTRRLAIAVLAPVLLSAATELAQALAGLGRACDSDDFVANSVGATAGALLAAVLTHVWDSAGKGPRVVPVRLAPSLVAIGAGTAVVAVAWMLWIDRAPYGPSGAYPVRDRHRTLATEVAQGLFGPGTPVNRVQYFKNGAGEPDSVHFITPTHSVSLRWPSGEVSSFHRAPVPVPPEQRIPPQEASAKAVDFMRRHFPWAEGVPHKTFPIGTAGDQFVLWRPGGSDPAHSRLGLLIDARGEVIEMADGTVFTGPLTEAEAQERGEPAPDAPPPVVQSAS